MSLTPITEDETMCSIDLKRPHTLFGTLLAKNRTVIIEDYFSAPLQREDDEWILLPSSKFGENAISERFNRSLG